MIGALSTGELKFYEYPQMGRDLFERKNHILLSSDR